MADYIYPYEERVDMSAASVEELRQILGLLLEEMELMAVADITPDYRSIRLARDTP